MEKFFQKSVRSAVFMCVSALLSCALSQSFAFAATGIPTAAKHAAIIEAATGDVLLDKDADASMPTSSMSKLMTMYLVFEAVKDGKLGLEEKVPVSVNAWKQAGSRMFVKEGDSVSVEDLARGVIVQSGNDAAVALAEAVGSTEANFAEMMNEKAKALGMAGSHFANATGMPDPQHYSTARDLAVLALHTLRDFPDRHHYYSEKEFTYNGIKQGNRNPLLYRDIGVDGMKTGHTEDAGYGLVASVLRDGRRLVLVVNGLKNMQERADETARLLDWAYREYGLYNLAKLGDEFAEAEVWNGVKKTVPLVAGADAVLSLPRGERAGLKAVARFRQPVPAPVSAGQEMGELELTFPDSRSIKVPLVAAAAVEKSGRLEILMEKLRSLTSGDGAM